MDYERKKELLTKENIKSDLKQVLYQSIVGVLVQASLLCLLFILLRILFIEYLSISTIVLDCIFGIIFVLYFINLIYDIKWIVEVNDYKFSILTDSLVGRKAGVPMSKTGVSGSYILEFSNYGEYTIPMGRNYKWSKFYDMFEHDALRASHVGDTFFVVLLRNGKKIAVAYNTRLFELEE